MDIWNSITSAVSVNEHWVEMAQTINNGLAQIGDSQVLGSVRAAATQIVDGITETDAFQNALQLSRSALSTADTAYMDAGYQEIANIAGDVSDAVSQTITRAQNSVADAATSYVERFERPMRSWEMQLTEEEQAMDATVNTGNFWQQTQNLPGGGLTDAEAAAFGPGMEDVPVVRESNAAIVDRRLGQVEHDAQVEWGSSQWGRDRSNTFARYAREAAETVQREEDARQAARASSRASRAAQAIQQQMVSDPQVQQDIGRISRQVNSVYTDAWANTGEQTVELVRTYNPHVSRGYDTHVQDLQAPSTELYGNVENEQIAQEVLQLGRRADPVMRQVNLRLVAGDDVGAIAGTEAEYARARVPSWQVEWVGEDEAVLERMNPGDLEEPLLGWNSIEHDIVEVELAALEPAEELAVIAPEVADGINVEVEALAASGGVSAVVGLALGAAAFAAGAIISTIDTPSRIHKRDDAIYARQVEQARVDSINAAAKSKIYTAWLHYKTPILHRRSMADADKRYTMIDPQTGLWRIVRVTEYRMTETKWSQATDHMWSLSNWQEAVSNVPLPPQQREWGRVVWPPENQNFHIAFQGPPARSSLDISRIELLHPAPMSPSQVAWNRATLMRRRAILIRNLMFEILRAGNRALVGAMVTHASETPTMGDDEGVLRIQMALCAHHGTMPSSLPHELEPIPGAVIDRWIRLATHELHVGADQGATNGFTRGDSVLWLGDAEGVLVNVSGHMTMRALRIVGMEFIDGGQWVERGTNDLQIDGGPGLHVIDANPFASAIYVEETPEPPTGLTIGLGIPYRWDVNARPPSAAIAPWVPPHSYRKASRQANATYQVIDQMELNILVWGFLVVNQMSMAQTLRLVDNFGPYSPRQMNLAFAYARQRRDTLSLERVTRPSDVTLVRRAEEEPFVGPTWLCDVD